MFEDAYEGFGDSPMAPTADCLSITPSDTTDLAPATKALYIGTGSTLGLAPVRGTTPVSFVNVADGTTMDVRVRTFRATGTTASNIVGLA